MTAAKRIILAVCLVVVAMAHASALCRPASENRVWEKISPSPEWRPVSAAQDFGWHQDESVLRFQLASEQTYPVNGFDPDGRCSNPAFDASGSNSSLGSLNGAALNLGNGLSISSNVGAILNGQNSLQGEPASEGSPLYDPVSQAVGYTGLGASALQFSSAGEFNAGDNGVIYTSGKFYGNQYVQTAKVGELADFAGRGLAGASFAIDLYGYSQGNISGTHLSANTAMTGVGFTVPPYGAIAAGGYFLIDTFYPAQNQQNGGFVSFVHDLGTGGSGAGFHQDPFTDPLPDSPSQLPPPTPPIIIPGLPANTPIGGPESEPILINPTSTPPVGPNGP